MTIPPSLRPWLLPAGAVLVLLLLAGIWNHDHRSLMAARAAAEAAQLQLKGQIVASQESTGALKADVARLLAENAELKSAYDAARSAAPGAQPVHAATLSTGIVHVEPTPRPLPPPAAAIPANSAATAPTAPAAACVLADGDTASIEVQEVTLQTKGGNFLVVGTAAAWRESSPRSKLFGGRFESSVSDVSGIAPPALPRWGAGVAGLCMANGCSAGPVLAFPPWHVFGFQLEANAGVLVGGPGAALLGSAVVRW